MAAKKYKNQLIKKENILENLVLIDGSNTDCITISGNIYKNYGNDLYFKKATYINKVNGYMYCGITYPNGNKSRRIHVLLAKAFIPNPNNYTVVGHMDNNKLNNNIDNLYWTTTQENTQKAYDDNLCHNAIGFEDTQSMPICVFDINFKLLYIIGSVSIAAKSLNYTKTGILYQCNHLLKTKPRKGLYFRYKEEYERLGFVL